MVGSKGNDRRTRGNQGFSPKSDTRSHIAHTTRTHYHTTMTDWAGFVMYATPGRARLSREFIRTRLGPQRAQLTEPEQLILGSPHSQGNGLMERQFWLLGYGSAQFANSANDVVDTPGYAVAIATEDLADMGDRGPSTFFVPTSAVNFLPAHPPQLAPAPTHPLHVTPTTASAGDAVASQPTMATPTPAVATNIDGTASASSQDTAATPVVGQPDATTSFAATPTGMSPGGVTVPSAPFAGPLLGTQLGDAGVNMSFAGVPHGGHRSPFLPYAQHALHHPPHGAARGTGAFYGAGGHPRYQPPPFGMNAMDRQSQHMMGGQFPGQAGHGGSPTIGASSPAPSFAARNPPPTARTTAGGGVTQLISHVKPVDVVLEEPFVPTVSDPAEFARNMRKELNVCHWDDQPMKDRVRQMLLNIHPSFRRSPGSERGSIGNR